MYIYTGIEVEIETETEMDMEMNIEIAMNMEIGRDTATETDIGRGKDYLRINFLLAHGGVPLWQRCRSVSAAVAANWPSCCHGHGSRPQGNGCSCQMPRLGE